MLTSNSGIDHIVPAVLAWSASRERCAACLSAAVYYFKPRSLRAAPTGAKQERSLLK